MSVDVTNTQTGGIQPDVKAEDYKANITPPKTEQVAVEPTPAVQPIPVAEDNSQTAPLENSEIPKGNEVESEPIKKPVVTSEQFEEDKVPVELPHPVDIDSVNTFDFEHFDAPINNEQEAQKPIYIDEQFNTPQDDELDAFSQFDLIPDEDKDPTEINIAIPDVSNPKIESTNEVVNPVIEPVNPSTQIVTQKPSPVHIGKTNNGIPHGTGIITTHDGTKVSSNFKEGKPDSATEITYPNGTSFVGAVRNGSPTIGTLTDSEGKKTTGVIENGKIVAPIHGENDNIPSKKAVDVKNPFKDVVSVANEKVKANKEPDDVWLKINAPKHEDVTRILTQTGLNVNAEEGKLKSIITQDHINGKKLLTAQEKALIEKVINPLGGAYNKDLHKISTKRVLDAVDVFVSKGASKNREGLKSLYETKAPLNEGQKDDISIINRANQIKQTAAKLHKGYEKELSGAIDFITSPKYTEWAKKEWNTGDRKVETLKFEYQLNKAYNAWLQHTGAQKGYVSRNAFDDLYGDDIKALHSQIIIDAKSKSKQNANSFGYEKQRKVNQQEEIRVGKLTSRALYDSHQETSGFYLKKNNDEVSKVKTEHKEKVNTYQKNMSERYQSAISEITNSNEEAKAIYAQYSERIKSSDDAEERKALSDELQEKLSSFPEVKKLNTTYEKEYSAGIQKLNKEAQFKIYDICGKNKDAFTKDLYKTYNSKAIEIERKSGYMAQYNAYNKASEVANSKEFKSANYNDKKQITEQAWNDHVNEVKTFFKGKTVRTPKDENEKLNVHFTQWTGAERPKTAKDVQIAGHLMGAQAHDKFRRNLIYKELNSDIPNTFQYKAMLEDKLSEVNDAITYLESSLDKDELPHNEDYLKYKQTKRAIQHGLSLPEHEQESVGSFLSGLTKGDLPFITAITNSFNNKNLIDATEKYAKGYASKADAGLLLTNSINNTLASLNPQSMSSSVGQGITSTLSFIAEMAATSGLGELGYQGTKTLLAKSSAKLFGEKAIVNATLKGGTKTATAVANALANPEAVTTIGKIAQFTLPRAAKVVGQTSALPSTNVSIQDKLLEDHYGSVALAHSGALDEIIMKLDKGEEGYFESVLRGYGLSASGVLVEMSGAPIGRALINPIERKLINYMATSQFLKRTVVATYFRRKAFTVDSFNDYIQKAAEKGYLSGTADEMVENVAQQPLDNMIEGKRIDEGINYESLGSQTLSTASTMAVIGGMRKVSRIVVRKNKAIAAVTWGDENQTMNTPMSTPIWNQFDLLVKTEKFKPAHFGAFVVKNNLDEEQIHALAHVYMKVNPAFKNNEFLKSFASTVSKDADVEVKPNDIAQGDVEVIEEEIPLEDEHPTIEQETELSPREIAEQEQSNPQPNNNQNQAGIPSEVGTVEEPIQTEPIQEGGSQEVAPSGMVQEPQEVGVKTVEELENERDLAINELAQRFQKVDIDNEEEASLERERRQPEFAKELEKINKQYDTEIESLKQNESTTPTNTTTDEDIQPTIEQGTEAPTSEGVQPTVEPITSEETAKVKKGSGGVIKFADNVEIPYKFKLVESEDLQPSHLPSGQRNPKHLIALAQPKERNDQGSRAASDKIASNIKLNEVGEAPNAYFGAPVVNSRNEVIQGNNRSIGIKKHYDQGKASYKQQLEEQAEKFGFTKEQVASMKNPVLVRETSVDDNVAIELGQYDVKDLESGGKQRIDAITTSRRLTDKDKAQIASLIFNGEHTTVKQGITANKKQIIDILKQHINIAQFNTAIKKDGTITPNGMDDFERIIQSMKFDGGSAVLPEVFESLPHTIKANVDNALQYIYSVEKEKSILPDLQNAMIALYEQENSGQNFEVWSNQTDIFTGATPKEAFSPFELLLAKKLTTFNKQKELSVIAKSYAEQINGTPEDMFSEAISGVSKSEAIRNLFNIEYNENNIKKQSEGGYQINDSEKGQTIVNETKTVLSKSEDFENNIKEQEVKLLDEMPEAEPSQDNPFTEISKKGDKVINSKSFIAKYGNQSGNIKEINDNFEDISKQLKESFPTKKC